MINPEIYDKSDGATEHDGLIFFSKVHPLLKWKRTAKVLDYGCGPGKRAFKFILPQIETFQGQLYSVDISKEMVEYARNNYPHSKIDYQVGDISGEFPFKNVKFDIIVSFYVLHHIGDIRNVFKGFYELLEEGGHFAFMTLTANSVYTKALGEIAKLDQWKDYMKDYKQFMVQWSNYPEGSDADMKNYHFRSLLNRFGFHVKYMEVQKKQYHFDDMDAFLELCVVINPFLKKIPECLHSLLKEDCRGVYTRIAGIPRDSKTITVTSEHVSAVAQKSVFLKCG